jgi:hypothetical protein
MPETRFHAQTEPQAKLVMHIVFFTFLDSKREDKRF